MLFPVEMTCSLVQLCILTADGQSWLNQTAEVVWEVSILLCTENQQVVLTSQDE